MSLSQMFDFGAIVEDPKRLDTWLKQHKILKEVVHCSECFNIMKEMSGRPLMICSKRSLYSGAKAIRGTKFKGTLFEGARAAPDLIMKIIYCYCLNLTYDQT